MLAADVTGPDGPEKIVACALEAFGRIDVVVNNAAIIRPAALGDIDRVAADEQVATEAAPTPDPSAA